ncbi:hypothetical protein [Flavihumibacter profundi]|jgi:hypothetical protein|uniref:hypothetical protein n=1 Tax=Flavihumibacter profundi TaxID=2716883 RepID=UPI001CC46C69|nr:hypothetical protein [Flavihumibacter profundi]MBZ5858995.1 hypothetical protein [Flavihumibacter profundi]
MKKVILPVVFAVLITACGPSTVIEKSWRDPNTTIVSGSWNKVLVVGLLKDETTRRVVEDQLVKRMKGKGVASYNYYVEKDVTEAKASGFKDKLITEGFDGAVVMRLVNVEKETSYVPGASSFPPYYGGFGPYYYNSWNSYYSPGYYTTDKIYNVETNIYSFKQDKLVWSGITQTTNPSKTEKMFNEIADVIGAKMRSEGFLK